MKSTNIYVKETATMGVYKHLKDLILRGHFQPGDWVREREIKELMDVSSTPIREALRMLIQERVLISVPHRGAKVKKFSKKELQDFYELRSEIEGLAAELAAMRRTSNQQAEMEKILDITEEELNENKSIQSEIVSYNNQFHDLVAQASGNQAVMQSLSQMRTEVNLLRIMSWKSESKRPATTLHQHRLILNAIINQDRKLARHEIQNHIWDSAQLVLNVAEKLNQETNH